MQLLMNVTIIMITFMKHSVCIPVNYMYWNRVMMINPTAEVYEEVNRKCPSPGTRILVHSEEKVNHLGTT